MWSQTKYYIYWKVRLSPEHEEVGAEPIAEFQVQVYA